MRPIYIPDFFPSLTVETLLSEIPWEEHTPARRECFMTEAAGKQYTYGVEKWARTYTSVEAHPAVLDIMQQLNSNRPPVGKGWTQYDLCEGWRNEDRFHYNVCFLNRYDNEQHMLGWHADNSPTMDHDHPIASVSFGVSRELWWRPNDQKGVVPPEQRQLLENGSALIMPAGFQREHQHRIPKGDRPMGPRVSLTYRRFVEG